MVVGLSQEESMEPNAVRVAERSRVHGAQQGRPLLR